MQLSHRDSKCCIASLFGTPRKFDAWFCLYHPVPWRFWKGTRNGFLALATFGARTIFTSCMRLRCLAGYVPTEPFLYCYGSLMRPSSFQCLPSSTYVDYQAPGSQPLAMKQGFLRRSGSIELQLVCSSRFAKQPLAIQCVSQPESSRSFDQIAVTHESHFVLHYLAKLEMLCLYHGFGWFWLCCQKVWMVCHWNYLGINGHLDMAQHYSLQILLGTLYKMTKKSLCRNGSSISS